VQEHYAIFGINERGTTLVYQNDLSSFTHEHYLDNLDRWGMLHICRALSDMALGWLNIIYRGSIDKHGLIMPVGTTRLIEEGNVESMPPSPGYRAALRDHRVVVGLSNSGLAVEIATHDANGPLAMARSIPFAELDALGPDTANMTIGDIILRTLVRLHPDPFAPFHNLSPQPEKGDLP
jgi:hypothetical protein